MFVRCDSHTTVNMPKRIGETPPWLCRPSSGARIFSDPVQQIPQSPSKNALNNTSTPNEHAGPKRLLAQRGTEVFSAVGNKLRWADLAQVKDRYEDDSRNGTDDGCAYKTIGLSVYYPIRQLVISPSELFLAVATDYTVHIIPLPDHASLATSQKSTIKVRSLHLGPAIHAMPSSPVVSILWHPLAAATASTDCLITITSDAALRMWEIDRMNQFSIEQPVMDIDLRKLADGVSCDQDFQSAGFGKSKGFSVDDIDMEVASACFGGRAEDDEDPWASMTLWVAMKNADVYALSPLLPSKWQPTATTIPALSTSVVSKMAIAAQEELDEDERRSIDQQYEWVTEIDSEDSMAPGMDEQAPDTRMRPTNPSAIPRLQGPFEVQVQDDDDFEVTDLYVLAADLEVEDDDVEEEPFRSRTSTGIPYTIIMLACSDGRLHVGLDLEGVSGQWLPRKGRNAFSVPMSESQDLVSITTIELDTSSNESVVSLTPDMIHRHTVFATVGSRIYSISLDEWANRLAEEIMSDTDADDRLLTRLETACQNDIAVIDMVVDVQDRILEPLSAPAVIDDLDVGYIILATSGPSVFSATFDQAHIRSLLYKQPSSLAISQHINAVDLGASSTEPDGNTASRPSRGIYQTPRCFETSAEYTVNQLKHRVPPQQRAILTEKPLRLSPAVLDLMTASHRIVSSYTAEIETGAAELFRRCERLREELGEQVKQMTDLADRLQRIKDQTLGEEVRPGEEKVDLDKRLDTIKSKQSDLKKRFDDLRRRAGQTGSRGKPLSIKENGWIEEIQNLDERVGNDNADQTRKDSLASRYDTVSGSGTMYLVFNSLTIDAQVKQLSEQLRAEVDRLQKSESDQPPQSENNDLATSRSSIASNRSRSSFPLVSSRYQKDRIAEVMSLVERESAVIDAAAGRLEKLKLSSGVA